MKTFIFWNGKYSGVVGGSLWDQFLTNARMGYGTCCFIDAASVPVAKLHLDKVETTPFQNVFTYGDNAKAVITKLHNLIVPKRL